MSHEISRHLGRDTIAFFGSTPWHKLGTPLSTGNFQDVDAVLAEAGMNWDVKRIPLYHAYEPLLGNQIVQNPYAYGVIRVSDGSMLSAIGRETQVVQNREAASILEPLLKEHGYVVDVAGALGNGSRCWMLVRTNVVMEPVTGDYIHGYLLLRWAHDNSGSLEAIPVQIRVVCANTEGMALAAAGGRDTELGRIFRIKKTSGIKERIEEAKVLVDKLAKVLKEQEMSLKQLAQRRITPQETAQLIEGILPLPKDKDGNEKDSETITDRRKAIANLIFTQPGAEMSGADVTTGVASAYSFINAVSYYFDHVRPTEAKSESAIMKAQASSIFGANAAVKLLAQAAARKLLVASN